MSAPMPPLDLTMQTKGGDARSLGSSGATYFGGFGAIKSGVSNWILLAVAVVASLVIIRKV